MRSLLLIVASSFIAAFVFLLLHYYCWEVEVASTGHNEVTYGFFSWHHNKRTIPMWEEDPTPDLDLWTIRSVPLVKEVGLCSFLGGACFLTLKKLLRTSRQAEETDAMKYRNFTAFVLCISSSILFVSTGSYAELTNQATISHSKLAPVSFSKVRVDDEFWAPRIRTVQSSTIRHLLEIAEKTGKLDNFAIVAGRKTGKIALHLCPDSDVYKILEAASYSLAWKKDPALERRVDELIASIANAQADDGYLNTQFMLPFGHPASPDRNHRHVKRFGYGPADRWSATVKRWPYGIGQLYCIGHLFEAAVAHYRATGKRAFLDVAIKAANNLDRTFDKSKPLDYADHPQVEISLFKLYEATGERRYLKLADFITHNSKFHRPPDIGNGESAKPLIEQRNAFGHCVRTMYIYSGATDLVRTLGDKSTRRALDSLWQNVVGRKMYVHGGIGNGTRAEQHGVDYDLPNERAYCECCASIAMGQWNHRLNLLYGDGRYADIVELEAYNSGLSGISLDGKKYFYRNRMAAGDRYRRRRSYLFCCPSKLPGFIAGITRWIYARDDSAIYVNMYVSGSTDTVVNDLKVRIEQRTRYPWDGRVRLSVAADKDVEFDICLRVPGWARNRPVPTDLYSFSGKVTAPFSLHINGRKAAVSVEKGYIRIHRIWKRGDAIDLNLPMPIRRVKAHRRVKADAGRVALQRGPIVYCLEAADNGGKVLDLSLPSDARITSRHRADLLGGVTVLRGAAMRNGKPVTFTAVPYFAWDNRTAGEMTVWIPEKPGDKIHHK